MRDLQDVAAIRAEERRAEKAWHACEVPPEIEHVTRWVCGVCSQHWLWRQPPRPEPQWVREAHGAGMKPGEGYTHD